MSRVAVKKNPELWERSKEEAVERLGGKWSARAAQLAVQIYKSKGGKYVGRKSPTNSLARWTREDWGTKSGKPSGKTGERYLPRVVRESLTEEEYAESTRKKRADTRRGKQWSPQPRGVREKSARVRREASDEYLELLNAVNKLKREIKKYRGD